MAFDVTSTPGVGAATKVSDYTRLRDAIKALASTGLVGTYFGGSLSAFVSDTAYVTVPESLVWQIAGTNLSGLTVIFECNMKASSDNSAVVTISMRLWNVNTLAAVAGSEVSVASVTPAGQAQVESGAITLPASSQSYLVQIKTSDVNQLVSGIGRVYFRA